MPGRDLEGDPGSCELVALFTGHGETPLTGGYRSRNWVALCAKSLPQTIESTQYSITRGFAEVATVVVAAEELVGLGVHGDELAVAPEAWVAVVGGLVAVGFVAHGFELVDDVVGELLFEVEAVGDVLVVEAGGVGYGLDVEVVVDGADDVVSDRCDDGEPPGVPMT